MADDNKPAKYFRYAIGEILLVVIGILIALQINNWNEHQKTVLMTENYILDVKKDLMTDTITFNSAIKRITKTIAKNKALLTPELIINLPIDSLAFLVSSSFHSTRIYKINNATFLKLSNTGFLESGVLSEVFSEINTYYTKNYVEYSEFIEWDEEQTIDVFHRDFLGNYKDSIDLTSLDSDQRAFLTTERKKETDVSYRNFLSSISFRNAALTNFRRKEDVSNRILLQKELATNLIIKINRGIENK